MVKLHQRAGQIATSLLLLSLLSSASVMHASAQTVGCQPTLSGDTGARIMVEVLERRPNDERVTVAGPATEVEARSNQLLRLRIRPLEGPAQPSGAGCPEWNAS